VVEEPKQDKRNAEAGEREDAIDIGEVGSVEEKNFDNGEEHDGEGRPAQDWAAGEDAGDEQDSAEEAPGGGVGVHFSGGGMRGSIEERPLKGLADFEGDEDEEEEDGGDAGKSCEDSRNRVFGIKEPEGKTGSKEGGDAVGVEEAVDDEEAADVVRRPEGIANEDLNEQGEREAGDGKEVAGDGESRIFELLPESEKREGEEQPKHGISGTFGERREQARFACAEDGAVEGMADFESREDEEKDERSDCTELSERLCRRIEMPSQPEGEGGAQKSG